MAARGIRARNAAADESVSDLGVKDDDMAGGIFGDLTDENLGAAAGESEQPDGTATGRQRKPKRAMAKAGEAKAKAKAKAGEKRARVDVPTDRNRLEQCYLNWCGTQPEQVELAPKQPSWASRAPAAWSTDALNLFNRAFSGGVAQSDGHALDCAVTIDGEFLYVTFILEHLGDCLLHSR